jgi:dipeptidyl-peptidase-4
MSSSAKKTSKKRLISIEDAIQRPAPGHSVPAAIQFSPDGSLITYLFAEAGGLTQDPGLTQNLFAYESTSPTGQNRLLAVPPDSGMREGQLSAEEELLRERMRQVSLGITQYIRDEAQGRILIPFQGSLYLLDNPDGEPGRQTPRLLFDSGGKPALDPQFSPDGEWVAFVQNAEIYIITVQGGQARQLTQGARGTGKTNGLAEYIAQEEMGRLRGYWWSPDSQKIGFPDYSPGQGYAGRKLTGRSSLPICRCRQRKSPAGRHRPSGGRTGLDAVRPAVLRVPGARALAAGWQTGGATGEACPG